MSENHGGSHCSGLNAGNLVSTDQEGHLRLSSHTSSFHWFDLYIVKWILLVSMRCQMFVYSK